MSVPTRDAVKISCTGRYKALGRPWHISQESTKNTSLFLDSCEEEIPIVNDVTPELLIKRIATFRRCHLNLQGQHHSI